MNWQASVSILSYPGVLSYIGKGVAFTLVLSVLAVVISILLGSVLALCRNYCTGKSRIFQWISTVYIEIFRNTPLLLWIFICLVACPCPKFFARKMWGLTSVEMKILFRAVVPTLLSQVISTVKDSSYLANLACIELMSRVRKILATANMFNGVGRQMVSDVFVLFGLAFVIYFVINFALSCAVRRMQRRGTTRKKQEAAL